MQEDTSFDAPPEDENDLIDLGAASEVTQAIGNRQVEPNLEPLYFE